MLTVRGAEPVPGVIGGVAPGVPVSQAATMTAARARPADRARCPAIRRGTRGGGRGQAAVHARNDAGHPARGPGSDPPRERALAEVRLPAAAVRNRVVPRPGSPSLGPLDHDGRGDQGPGKGAGERAGKGERTTRTIGHVGFLRCPAAAGPAPGSPGTSMPGSSDREPESRRRHLRRHLRGSAERPSHGPPAAR